MDNSRASSVENEVSSLSLNENSKKSYSEDDDVDSGNDPADMIRPKIRRSAGRKSARALPKKLMVKIIKQNSLEEGDLPDSNSSTPPLDASRPVRAAVANANAISGKPLHRTVVFSRLFSTKYFFSIFLMKLKCNTANQCKIVVF